MLKTPRRPLASILRALGSLLPASRRSPETRGAVIRPWRRDSDRTYPTTGLTPAGLLSHLQAADAGAPQMQFELFGEMLEKWPRLAAVEKTRRLALTGLDWDLEVPAAVQADERTADLARAAVDHCRATLLSLERYRDALNHLASAIGYGIGLAELVWDNSRLVDIVPVPYTRLCSDPHEPWRLRVLTEEESATGVALDEHPLKWVVHRPRAVPGRNFESGLLRASALLYLAQNLSFKDWLVYSQIAGMPVRVAQFEPGTPEADKQELLQMLTSLGTEAVAAFAKNVDLKFVETARGGSSVYRPLQEYCNTEITILWLGQHLTTDIGASGSRAAAEIHDRVREDLLVDDIADEGQTVRRDVLTPLVRARFGDAAPVPVFRRSLMQAVDTKVLAETLAVAVKELGLPVPRGWMYRALGIPEPSGDEPVLSVEGRP